MDSEGARTFQVPRPAIRGFVRMPMTDRPSSAGSGASEGAPDPAVHKEMPIGLFDSGLGGLTVAAASGVPLVPGPLLGTVGEVEGGVDDEESSSNWKLPGAFQYDAHNSFR